MELKPADLGSWTPGQPPARLMPAGGAVAALVFGPDEGGVLELSRALVAGADDRQVFDGGALATSLPDILANLLSPSLFARQPALLVQGVDDRGSGAVEQMLDAAGRGPGVQLVLTAGDLKAASKLRKLLAARKDAVSAPLFRMRGREIEAFARTNLQELGIAPDRDALGALAQHLPGDRAIARRACEVLALHALGALPAGRNEPAPLGAREVREVLEAVDEAATFAPLDHALDGRPDLALRALLRRLGSGEKPIGLLRAFGRRAFQIRDLLAAGQDPRTAVERARPPIFWAERDAMIRRLGRLTVAMLDEVLVAIDRTEQDIVERDAPPHVALGRLLASGIRPKPQPARSPR